MKQQSDFKFSSEQLEAIKLEIKAYFLDELDIDLSDLQVSLFISFLNEKIGKTYYNQGVSDAIEEIKERANDLILLLKE